MVSGGGVVVVAAAAGVVVSGGGGVVVSGGAAVGGLRCRRSGWLRRVDRFGRTGFAGRGLGDRRATAAMPTATVKSVDR